jgi:hypothetical protein
MEFAIFWVGFAIIVGIFASRRGRSGFGWFLLSALISPLLAGLLVLVLANLKDEEGKPNPSTHVKCPDCREFVLKEARVCKHCGCKLIPQ